MTDRTVELYEDNAGTVYLHRAGQTWSLGQVTPDMDGSFPRDAAAWASGEWEPSETDGQVPADLDGLTHIATWIPGGILVETDENGERLAGFGGSDYIGHVLADLDSIRSFLAGLRDDVERARHLEHLIGQARTLQGWLGDLRAMNIAHAAEDARQTAIANRLGITEGRVSQLATQGRKLIAMAPLADSNVVEI